MGESTSSALSTYLASLGLPPPREPRARLLLQQRGWQLQLEARDRLVAWLAIPCPQWELAGLAMRALGRIDARSTASPAYHVHAIEGHLVIGSSIAAEACSPAEVNMAIDALLRFGQGCRD